MNDKKAPERPISCFPKQDQCLPKLLSGPNFSSAQQTYEHLYVTGTVLGTGNRTMIRGHHCPHEANRPLETHYASDSGGSKRPKAEIGVPVDCMGRQSSSPTHLERLLLEKMMFKLGET